MTRSFAQKPVAEFARVLSAAIDPIVHDENDPLFGYLAHPPGGNSPSLTDVLQALIRPGEVPCIASAASSGNARTPPLLSVPGLFHSPHGMNFVGAMCAPSLFSLSVIPLEQSPTTERHQDPLRSLSVALCEPANRLALLCAYGHALVNSISGVTTLDMTADSTLFLTFFTTGFQMRGVYVRVNTRMETMVLDAIADCAATRHAVGGIVITNSDTRTALMPSMLLFLRAASDAAEAMQAGARAGYMAAADARCMLMGVMGVLAVPPAAAVVHAHAPAAAQAAVEPEDNGGQQQRQAPRRPGQQRPLHGTGGERSGTADTARLLDLQANEEAESHSASSSQSQPSRSCSTTGASTEQDTGERTSASQCTSEDSSQSQPSRSRSTLGASTEQDTRERTSASQRTSEDSTRHTVLMDQGELETFRRQIQGYVLLVVAYARAQRSRDSAVPWLEAISAADIERAAAAAEQLRAPQPELPEVRPEAAMADAEPPVRIWHGNEDDGARPACWEIFLTSEQVRLHDAFMAHISAAQPQLEHALSLLNDGPRPDLVAWLLSRAELVGHCRKLAEGHLAVFSATALGVLLTGPHDDSYVFCSCAECRATPWANYRLWPVNKPPPGQRTDAPSSFPEHAVPPLRNAVLPAGFVTVVPALNDHYAQVEHIALQLMPADVHVVCAWAGCEEHLRAGYEAFIAGRMAAVLRQEMGMFGSAGAGRTLWDAWVSYYSDAGATRTHEAPTERQRLPMPSETETEAPKAKARKRRSTTRQAGTERAAASLEDSAGRGQAAAAGKRRSRVVTNSEDT
ncbi:hypothetical protein TSOC_013218 [Tetrabaena socialis]|uniref:Uncharacterized protein n=1 Tax=Tetrabaena socialis TaxID=47790 RepID=A0A2J7ZKX6_9CHLO|nr:hypothetical protein TSOC_013218 [Tetrabaena socialis]|eukprot:PNH00929.1 hypothetical protein TSOC_013218 [Tetrabaena socialis]